MGVVIPVGFALLQYRWTLSGDPEEMVSTIGVDLDGNDPQVVCDERSAEWEVQFPAASVATGYTYEGTRLYEGQGAGNPPIVFEHNHQVVGTFNSATLPQNVALLVRKLSASAGRANRGRMYLPPFAIGESVVDHVGVIGSSSVTALNTKLSAIRAQAGAAVPSPFVILHDAGSPVTTPTAVTQLVLDPKVATQRTRLRR